VYTNDHIKLLNEFGVLSSALLARKYKMNFDYARLVLQAIVEGYENVAFRSQDQIYIEGREPKEWQPKPKHIGIRPRKPPRWKDITKP
jgi:hypothetical protein